MKRRAFLASSVGVSILGSVALGTVSAADEPSGSVTFNDQTTDGTSIVVAEISTEIDATIGVRNQNTDNTDGFEEEFGIEIDAGTYEDYEVELNPPLTDTAEVAVSLYDDDGSGFARDTAEIIPDENVELIDGIEPTLIEADPNAGFEYPYYLYAPSKLASEDPKPLLVEPANSGTTSDDLQVHLDAGKNTIERSSSRDMADELGSPFIVPVFPRPQTEPVDWTHYIHALDDTSLSIDGGPLERVDLQVLAMAEHAQDYLAGEGYTVSTKGISLNGFSAAGNFVERFTVLHPEEVISVTAGGLNGMPLLPLDEFSGRELPYHVGTANVKELTGTEPDLDALDETNQFLYMGAEDNNDTIPYDDAWTDDDLRQLALDVYGDDMIVERFPTSQEAYREAGVEAQFRVYPDAGHTPRPAIDDMVEFHRRSREGEDMSEFGDDITANTTIDASATTASVGEEITFDASASTGAANAEIVAYQWEFGTGSEAIGETTTYAYEESGEFTVTMTAITENGVDRQTTKDVEITGNGDDDTDGAHDSPFTNDDGIVDVDGLRLAIEYWRSGKVVP